MIHHDQSQTPIVAPLPSSLTRRGFLGSALATSALGGLLASRGTAADEAVAPAAAPSRVIKLGLIGCGGRGAWLGGLFKKHGGFEIHATADYDEAQANAAGDALGVDKARRFSGLSAYQKLIASGCEAVTVVNIPRFHATHGPAAIEAGLHVYAAKPVAIDVPGALAVRAAGKLATGKKLVYLVDYQIPTDPINIEVVKRIHEGGVGRLMHIDSHGFSGAWPDPALRSADHLLHRGQWLTAIPLSGDFIVEYSVHTINAVLWAVGKRPVKATGFTRRVRANAKGDGRDVYLVTYEFDDGLLWTHRCQALDNVEDAIIRTRIFGDTAHAEINYWGRSFLRGGKHQYGGGAIEGAYNLGTERNIAAFHQAVCAGDCGNPTVARAADDILTAVLGREAAARGTPLAMDDLIRENLAIPFDLTGAKA
jgi:predicted dehydrogenase